MSQFVDLEAEASGGESDSMSCSEETTGSEHSAASLEERRKRNADRDENQEIAVEPHAKRARADTLEEEDDDEEGEETSNGSDSGADYYVVWGNEGRKKIAYDAELPIKKPSYEGGNVPVRSFDKIGASENIILLNEKVIGDEEDVEARIEMIMQQVSDLAESVGIDTDNFIDKSSKGMYEFWLEAVPKITWIEFVEMDLLQKKKIVEQLDKNAHDTYTAMLTFVYQLMKCRDQDIIYYERAQEVIRSINTMYSVFYRMVDNFYERFSALQRFTTGSESVFVTRIPYDLYEDVLPPVGTDEEERAKANELLFIKDTLRTLCKKKMLRKKKDQVMKPVYYEGKFAWAYKPMTDIESWLNENVSRRLGRVFFEAFEGKKGNANDVRDYVVKRSGISELYTTRYLISFQNGVYFIEKDKFVPHDEMSVDLLPAPNVFACTYIDEPFNHHSHLRNVHLPFPDDGTRPPVDGTAFDIPTPCFDKIMRDQRWPYEVQATMYCMFGRLLYDQDYLDAEQKAIFCYGRKNTGKSTFCKILSMIYPPHLIGSCATAAEKTFGLQAFLGVYLIVQPEVRDNWQMEPSDFMKMIAGDIVHVARKFKMGIDLAWRALMILAGNEVMGWNDDHAAIARRLLIFPFNHAIEVDMGMEAKLQKELPAIICKCVRYYLARVHYYPSSTIPLPTFFRQSTIRFLKIASPIYKFMHSKDLVKGEGYYVPFSTLINAFKAFHKGSPKGTKLNTAVETWRVAFEDEGWSLTEHEEIRVYPEDQGEPRQDFFLEGFDLASNRNDFG